MSRVSNALRSTAAVAALSLLVSTARGTTCVNYYDECTATTVVSVHKGSTTIPCLPGQAVAKIDASVTCGLDSFGPVRFYRCANFSQGFSFTDLQGRVHTFTVITTWGEVLWGNCDPLLYSVA